MTVTIWKIPLKLTELQVEALMVCLSDEEQVAARRFKFDMHRRRYVAAHFAMNNILADELRISTEEIQYNKNPYGKPFISNYPVNFNLSHSEELALLIVSNDCEVGIDVEYMKRVIDVRGVAARFFHPEEVEQLLLLPEDEQMLYFYRVWTAKEAFLKAKGVGIADHLKSFSLDVIHAKSCKIHWACDELKEFNDWFSEVFSPEADYLSTYVCSEASRPRITDYQF